MTELIDPVPEAEDLERRALESVRQGMPPPREAYEAPYRDRIAWCRFPTWAWPNDPELFDAGTHEG
jgi:hypothetical protein